MPRGGKRQGTPGKAFSNRTDLATNYAPDSGGMAASGGQSAALAPAPPTLARTPDDSPMLSAPSARPGEPLTAGLDYGPGPSSEALGMPGYGEMSAEDLGIITTMLPDLKAAANMDGTPETFKSLVRYLSRLS